MIAPDLYLQIIGFLNDYTHVIDEDRLEAWPEFFAEDGTYQIVPRENRKQGLPGVILMCSGRDMMLDRIRALREANEFNIHTDRHVTGLPALSESPEGIRAVSSYAVFQTDQEGESRLFSVGVYEDLIDVTQSRLCFHQRTVVLDTYAIPNLLATPI